MRIVQLIDSLNAGGAERMAVNYANLLAEKIEFSGLAVSRFEGSLCNEVDKKVSYIFLNRKKIIDFSVIIDFRKYLKTNKIQIIQCHGTSFFFAFLVKMTLPKIKLIWHDHYGDSDFLKKRKSFVLKFCSPYFYGIISVNQKLKNWAQKVLKFKNVIFLRNFTIVSSKSIKQTYLKGIESKRIVQIANLREQKNHELIIEIALKLRVSYPEWTFHLVGNDFKDDYSKKIKKLIADNDLYKNVYLYGSRQDIKNIINQSEIAVLSSKSEGLPVSLLEYGMNLKPVLVTNVGEISSIVCDGINGYMVDVNDVAGFYNKLVNLIENEDLRTVFSKKLQITVNENFSKDIIIKQYLKWLKCLN